MRIKRFTAILCSFALIVSITLIGAEANTLSNESTNIFNSTSESMSFEDLDGLYPEAYVSIAYVYSNDLMDGVSDREFKPDDNLTRAMYVTVLGRTAEINPSDYSGLPFSDEVDGKWYVPYIQWAFENEITYGIGHNLFGVDLEVTREQIATFITRYLRNEEIELEEYDLSSEDYNDFEDISSWAADSVDYVTRTQIMHGDEDGNFRPQDSCTRAEAAIIFTRLDELINGDNEITELYEYIGMTGNDVIADFGPDYTRDTYEGEGIGYVEEGITFGLSGIELDSEVVCVVVESDRSVGFGFNAQMTYKELKARCSELGILVDEPGEYPDQNEDFQYATGFQYNGYEFEYDWSIDSDPNTTPSCCVWIYAVDSGDVDVTSLDTPIIGEWTHDESNDEADGLNVSWSKVDGAQEYEYIFYFVWNETSTPIREGVTENTNASCFFQDIGDSIRVEIRAKGEKNGQTVYSEWATAEISADQIGQITSVDEW